MRSQRAASMAAAFFLCAAAYAQNNKPVNSGQLIAEGIKLHDQGKYKEAIETYRRIPKNDTNYVFSLYEIAYSQSSDSTTFDDATNTCREGLKVDAGQYEHDFLLLLASNIDNQGGMDHALKLYDSALVKYPNSQGLMLNKGITLLRKKNYEAAEKIFQGLLIKNPYYNSAHFRLAQCALQKGQMIEAMMCLYTYLVNNPQGNQAKNIIKILDNISKAKDDVLELVNKRQEGTGNFAAVEQIVLSKIALDKGYKVLTDLDDPIFRQLQVMMEKLEFDESNPDFYMQFYVPYLKNIFAKKLFEPAVMQAFSDINIETIQRYVKKNSKEINQALTVFAESFNDIRSTRELDFTKRKSMEPEYHFDNGVLFAKGKVQKEQLVGKWEFYHKNGNIKSAGEYDQNGKKTGKWTYYYENGKLSDIEEFKGGLLEGQDISYNRDGVMTSKSTYRNGKQEGEKSVYYYPGHLRYTSTYKDGSETGKYTEYSNTGRLKTEAGTAEGELHGTYTTYHNNGKPELITRYEKGKLAGSYKSFYDNGQLRYETNYVNGEINGDSKSYHENGKLASKSTYINGLIEGDELQYNDEGTLVQKITYKKGKAEGLAEYFDDDGKLYSTFLFDNDRLKQAKYFDKTGKEISSSTRQSKMIDLNIYTADGFKGHSVTYNDKAEIQGRETYYYKSGRIKETDDYKDGLLEGTAHIYFPDGSKQTVVNYHEGKKHGDVKNYYINGKVRSEGWYENGDANGDWIEYNEKGTIVAITTYMNDEVYGTKRSFFPNGKLDDEEVYKSGWLVGINQYDTLGKRLYTLELPKGSGKYHGIHFNGKTKYEGTYVNGNVDGPFKSYFFDGSISVAKNYDRGYLNGEYTDYHFGGKVYSKGKYELGNKVGVWKYYTREGKPLKEENYKDGELDGKVIYYFPDGKPEREFVYKNGDKEGSYKRYAMDGQLCYVLNYKNDVPVSYSYADKNNQLVPAIPIKGGNGKVKTFYANGTVSSEFEYTDGELTGPFKIYFPNGKVYYEEENQVNGETLGKLIEYYPNGKKQSEYNYYYNNADGPFKEFYEDGKIKEEGVYYNGYIHGTVKQYDATGKVTEKREYYYGTLINVTK